MRIIPKTPINASIRKTYIKANPMHFICTNKSHPHHSSALSYIDIFQCSHTKHYKVLLIKLK